MKEFKKGGLLALLLALSLSFALLLGGCAPKEEPAPAPSDKPAAEKPVEKTFDAQAALIEGGKKYFANKPQATIAAADLNSAILGGDETYQIIDIRSAEHYAAGHIKGAINIPFKDALSDDALKQYDPNKTLVIVCYTGHTASFATGALGTIGYKVTPLKFGMSGWLADKAVIGLDPVAAGPGNYPVVTEATAPAGPFDLPKFASEGAEDLVRAGQAQYENFFKIERAATIANADVFTIVTTKDDSYQIVDVRDPESYAKGHIEGAINIPWTKIVDEADKLDPSKKIVLVCVTGHTAGHASGVVNLIGYEAYNMKFGMSGWNYDTVESHYDPATIAALPVEK